MRRFLILASVLFFPYAPTFADEPIKQPIQLDLKIIKLILPFQDLSAPYLYDIVNQENLLGLETTIARSGRVKAVIGAAEVEGPAEALPYVGADVDVSEKYFGERFNVGGWLAYDFDTKESRGGLKASVKLW